MKKSRSSCDKTARRTKNPCARKAVRLRRGAAAAARRWLPPLLLLLLLRHHSCSTWVGIVSWLSVGGSTSLAEPLCSADCLFCARCLGLCRIPCAHRTLSGTQREQRRAACPNQKIEEADAPRPQAAGGHRWQRWQSGSELHARRRQQRRPRQHTDGGKGPHPTPMAVSVALPSAVAHQHNLVERCHRSPSWCTPCRSPSRSPASVSPWLTAPRFTKKICSSRRSPACTSGKGSGTRLVADSHTGGGKGDSTARGFHRFFVTFIGCAHKVSLVYVH